MGLAHHTAGRSKPLPTLDVREGVRLTGAKELWVHSIF